jgi:hypothetical protein
MLLKFTAFILITILINACCTSTKTSQMNNNSPGYKNIAGSKLGKDYRVIFSPDSSYIAACNSGKMSGNNISSPLKFFIYDLKNEKTLFEENLPNGKVEWINKHQLKVSTEPGIVSGKEDKNNKMFGYIYDVKQKRKINPLIDIN